MKTTQTPHHITRMASVSTTFALCLAASAAAAAPLLQYAFKSGEKYVYEITITADTEYALETRQGHAIFTVKASTGGRAELTHDGALKLTRQTKEAKPSRFPGRPFLWADTVASHAAKLTVGSNGKIITSERDTPLPYMLGDFETLVIEELPAASKDSWEASREVLISEKSRSRFPSGPFRPGTGTEVNRNARETIKFKITQSKPDAIHIDRRYTLASVELTAGKPRLALTGDGEMVFSPKDGVMTSGRLNYEYVSNRTNESVRIPITIAYRLLGAAEAGEVLNDREKQRADALAKAAKATEVRPLEPGEREQLLSDLKSRTEGVVQRAAERLSRTSVDDHAAEVARALEPLLTSHSSRLRVAGTKALAVWGNDSSVAALGLLVDDPDIWVRKASIEALGGFKKPEAAVALATRLVHMPERMEAAKALRQIGSAAESAVQPYLKDRDLWVQVEACKVLGEIGTKDSLPPLEAYLAGASGLGKSSAQKAISEIKRRKE